MSEPSQAAPQYQDLSRFAMPDGFRGRSRMRVQFWWLVQATLFRWSPQIAYGFRAALLRRFGCKVGRGAIIRPSVTITYPWKVSIGDYAWIGDNATLYSLGEITIGRHAVVSQRTYLCAGDHEYMDITFPIRSGPIHVGEQCWIAADTFVAPGVSIGDATVVGARSTVLSDMPAAMVCAGHPCRPIKHRAKGTPSAVAPETQ